MKRKLRQPFTSDLFLFCNSLSKTQVKGIFFLSSSRWSSLSSLLNPQEYKRDAQNITALTLHQSQKLSFTSKATNQLYVTMLEIYISNWYHRKDIKATGWGKITCIFRSLSCSGEKKIRPSALTAHKMQSMGNVMRKKWDRYTQKAETNTHRERRCMRLLI